MTNDQWAEVERRLRIQFQSVHLSVDGYEVCLILVPDKGLRQCIAVYVNGYIKVEWVDKDCEIRRRFYNKHTRTLLKISKLKEISKKDWETLRKKYVYEYFSPYWGSFARMKRHLIKNNNDIKLTENRRYKK